MELRRNTVCLLLASALAAPPAGAAITLIADGTLTGSAAGPNADLSGLTGTLENSLPANRRPRDNAGRQDPRRHHSSRIDPGSKEFVAHRHDRHRHRRNPRIRLLADGRHGRQRHRRGQRSSVPERHGKGLGDGSTAKVKQVFKIDLAGATDITNLSGAAAKAAAVAKSP